MKEFAFIILSEKITSICGISSFVILVISFFKWLSFNTEKEKVEEEELERRKKRMKKQTTLGVILGIISILIPTKKEIYTVIGLGGTIEYIMRNDVAKELPDKCIIALDKLIDEYNKEEPNNEK